MWKQVWYFKFELNLPNLLVSNNEKEERASSIHGFNNQSIPHQFNPDKSLKKCSTIFFRKVCSIQIQYFKTSNMVWAISWSIALRSSRWEVILHYIYCFISVTKYTIHCKRKEKRYIFSLASKLRFACLEHH